ncbi:MAG: hypothetical protein ACRDGM_02830 [bacterium]
MVAWVGSLVVLLHVVINIAHAVAHRQLGIAISAWQTGFVAMVIGLGPIAAAALLWTSRSRVGAWVLGGSMTSSLLFGTYYHYIAISPDHVRHLPPGDQQALFRWTALLLAISELLGLAVSLWAISRMRPTGEGR